MPALPRYLINGQADACLSPLDRGLQYGDGLFETIAVVDGIPQHWARHTQRLIEGCVRLAMPMPDCSLLWQEALALTDGAERAVLKVIWTRGVGTRGYRAPQTLAPTRILSAHAYPQYSKSNAVEGVQAWLCATLLARNPSLAGMKHLNRLEQVLARGEWDDPDIAEGLMCDTAGNVVEGTMSNLFCVIADRLVTPSLEQCGVAGIARGRILDHLRTLDGFDVEIRELPLAQLPDATAVYLCNSLIGIWPVRSVCGAVNRQFPVFETPWTTVLRQALTP